MCGNIGILLTVEIARRARKGYDMNDKNSNLFFGEDDVTITLTDEDGKDMDATILAAFEIQEMAQEYIAVLEVGEDGEPVDAEVMILRYDEDGDGNPDISAIDETEEYEIAAESFKQLLKSGAIEGFDISDDEDEEDESGDYLSDIGEMFPGVSIDTDKM